MQSLLLQINVRCTRLWHGPTQLAGKGSFTLAIVNRGDYLQHVMSRYSAWEFGTVGVPPTDRAWPSSPNTELDRPFNQLSPTALVT
jgi:hypothetical protein